MASDLGCRDTHDASSPQLLFHPQFPPPAPLGLQERDPLSHAAACSRLGKPLPPPCSLKSPCKTLSQKVASWEEPNFGVRQNGTPAFRALQGIAAGAQVPGTSESVGFPWTGYPPPSPLWGVTSAVQIVLWLSANQEEALRTLTARMVTTDVHFSWCTSGLAGILNFVHRNGLLGSSVGNAMHAD